jgi:hypothetical protein
MTLRLNPDTLDADTLPAAAATGPDHPAVDLWRANPPPEDTEPFLLHLAPRHAAYLRAKQAQLGMASPGHVLDMILRDYAARDPNRPDRARITPAQPGEAARATRA